MVTAHLYMAYMNFCLHIGLPNMYKKHKPTMYQ